MIKIHSMSFSYGKKKVLNNVDLYLKKGSLTALIGLNGAGKSTIFGCLTKSNKISKGSITVDGINIDNYAYADYARVVSIVPQVTSLIQNDVLVRDFLVEGRTPYLKNFSVPCEKDYEIVEATAKDFNIENLLDSNFSKLSGGQQQMILIARTLVQNTPIILFDEPMSSLDLKNQYVILRIIKQLSKEGKTIIFSTHNPNHALLLNCDVALLKNGEILRHGDVNFCFNDEGIKDIFGENVVINKCDRGNYIDIIW